MKKRLILLSEKSVFSVLLFLYYVQFYVILLFFCEFCQPFCDMKRVYLKILFVYNTVKKYLVFWGYVFKCIHVSNVYHERRAILSFHALNTIRKKITSYASRGCPRVFSTFGYLKKYLWDRLWSLFNLHVQQKVLLNLFWQLQFTQDIYGSVGRKFKSSWWDGVRKICYTLDGKISLFLRTLDRKVDLVDEINKEINHTFRLYQFFDWLHSVSAFRSKKVTWYPLRKRMWRVRRDPSCRRYGRPCFDGV